MDAKQDDEQKMVRMLTALAVTFAVAVGAFGADYVVPASPLVRERLEWFQDQKLCLMLHFGLYSILGITESWPLSSQDAFWARSDIEWTSDDDQFKRDYFGLCRSFNPVRFNAESWVKVAKRCGFKYIAFTTKHHDGFCLWDTKLTDYKTADPSCPFSANPNADIVRKLFDACRAEGLGISAYFSKVDWHHDDFWENQGIGRRTTRYPTYKASDKPEKWRRFQEFTRSQIVELVRDYGPIDILWLDGNWVSPQYGYDLDMRGIIDAARAIQPNLISVDRGSKDEFMNIHTPEQTVPAEEPPYPWESCVTMADGWGYHYDDNYKSPRALIHLLVDVVAKGGNLALNVGPMPDGRLPAPALERMEIMGDWLRKHGKAIYATRTTDPVAIGDWRFTKGKDGTVYAIRLWRENEGHRVSAFLPQPKGLGMLKRVTHLQSGRELEFAFTIGDMERGYNIRFPSGFGADAYADAFVVQFASVEDKIRNKNFGKTNFGNNQQQ